MCDITKIHKLWHTRHKYPIWEQSLGICYEHKGSMMVDHCTQHEQNPLDILLQTYNIYEIIDINATLLQRAKVYFKSSQYRGWLLYYIWTKFIHSLLRYHNKHITFKNTITIITQIWNRVKCYFACIISATHGTWLLYQIWIKST